MTFNLDSARVLVTGGHGFLGSHVVEKLQARGAREVIAPTSGEYDLTRAEAIDRLLRDVTPDAIVHLAARVGGIGANQAHPGSFFYQNLIMGTELLEAARRLSVPKFVGIGTICSYPKHTPVPFREETLWDGYPEETNAPYGLAKKMLLVQSQAYRAEYGYNAIHLLLVNLYGPRDNFDLETSHVIPALIRKCVEARERGDRELACWGDGSPTREFLYVEDAADAIIRALTHYDSPEPINVGSGIERSIGELASLIAEVTGFSGELRWDSTRPNGQPRRALDVSRARDRLGWTARTDFRAGLAATVAWYLSSRQPLRQQP